MTPTDSIYSGTAIPLSPDSVFSFVHETDTVADTAEEGFAFCLDSIFRLRDTIEPIRRTSVFNGHELASRHDLLIPRLVDGNNMWLFGFIVAVLILLTLVLRTRRVKVGILLQAGIIQRKMDMLMRETSFTRFSFFLYSVLLFSFTAATLPYYMLQSQLHLLSPNSPFNSVVEYALVAGTLTVVLLVRQGVTLWLINLFTNKDTARYYTGNTQIFLLTDTIVLLPFSMLIFFSPIGNAIAPVAITIAALLVVIRIIRIMIIILSATNNSKFYLFYYLCTVEIVPILIIAKLLLS